MSYQNSVEKDLLELFCLVRLMDRDIEPDWIIGEFPSFTEFGILVKFDYESLDLNEGFEDEDKEVLENYRKSFVKSLEKRLINKT